MQKTRNLITPENPAKAILQRYRWQLIRRDALLDEIDAHYSRACNCTVQLDPNKTGGGGSAGDTMAAAICAAADAKDQLARAIAELNAALAFALKLADVPTDDRQKTVLHLRYIDGLDWTAIQAKMAYEKTQVFTIHGRALLAVNRYLQKNPDENGL